MLEADNDKDEFTITNSAGDEDDDYFDRVFECLKQVSFRSPC